MPRKGKLVMELEECDYLTATGIALGEVKPSHTTYGMNWRSLIAELEAQRKSINGRLVGRLFYSTGMKSAGYKSVIRPER